MACQRRIYKLVSDRIDEFLVLWSVTTLDDVPARHSR